MDGRSECNRSLAYAEVNLDCPAHTHTQYIDVEGCVLPLRPAAVAVERLGGSSLYPHPAASPTTIY